MSTTKESAEALALRGLMLLVVEVQNILGDEDLDMFEKIEQIEDIAEADSAREFVQLARAALDSKAAPAAIPAAAAGVHL